VYAESGGHAKVYVGLLYTKAVFRRVKLKKVVENGYMLLKAVKMAVF